ncbi:hypothetical protein GHK92_10885 [Nocardioides sp. dk4132]|uniref:hypothetical protein n=1 Tax=unclassified Nocardioides TaxID=2615069 RepID=UPI001295FDA2|nr:MULTISPECIES: hypothetical protein [unclassified Nocardioides]MQW76382.1 hypothetical protein [Nocardioides sp. dk4132]QGA07342.1 hypothetical protein GFH29_08040 [Nocardioides sp. dk884]
MDDVLAAALAPVLADVRATGAPEPRVVASDWTADPALPAAMLWSADGSGVGMFVRAAEMPAARAVHASEQVQDWVLEELPGVHAVWPPCPAHAAAHSLSPVLVDGVARWVCASDRVVIAAIGELGTTRAS